MTPFIVLQGIPVAMFENNIDTDQLCPKQHLLRLEKTGFDRALFSDRRFEEDGTERNDFVLNQAPWRQARILVAGENFGCGSSREHAVWALVQFGIRCVIAPSFGDIFFQNSVNSGLLALRLAAPEVQRLARIAADAPGSEWRIDLPAQTVQAASGDVIPFDIDATQKDRLLHGLDEIDLTLRHESAIDAFEARQRAAAPWLWRAVQF